MTNPLLAFALIALAVACTQSPPAPPAPPPAQTQARLEVTPAALLLERVGATAQLEIKAFDAQGNAVPTPLLSFAASDPSVTVSADGTVRASALGSSRVTVSAGGLSASVTALVATPAAGAILVSDAQVSGDIRPLDANAPLDVGYRYAVTLTGIAPPPVGSLIIGTGAKPIGGRVVAASGDSVTIEVLALDELLPDLRLSDLKLDLRDAPLEISPAVRETFDIVQTPAGGFNLTLKAGKTLSSQRIAPRVRPQDLNGEFSFFEIGPLACKAKVSALQLTLARFDVNLDPGLTVERIWNAAQKRIVVTSNAKASIIIKPSLQSVLQGAVSCELDIGKRHIPLPGPVGLILGFAVPFGVGFEIEAKSPLVAGLSWEFKREISATARAGVDCIATCNQVAEFTDTSLPFSGLAAPSFKFELPSLSALRLEANLYAYAFAKLQFGGSQLVSSLGGAVGFRRLAADLLTAKAGLKLEGKFASEETQAKDAAYASDYRLLFEAKLEAGKAIESFFRFVRFTLVKLELKFVQEIASSPKGVLTADRAAFAAGDTVAFKVAFTPATLQFPLFGFNVAKVRVYKKVIAPSGDVTLVLSGEEAMQPGQTEVTINAVTTQDGTLGDYAAFVETALLGTPRLEVEVAAATNRFSGTISIVSKHITNRTPNFLPHWVHHHHEETKTIVLEGIVNQVTDQALEFTRVTTSRFNRDFKEVHAYRAGDAQCNFVLHDEHYENEPSISPETNTHSPIILVNNTTEFDLLIPSHLILGDTERTKTLRRSFTAVTGSDCEEFDFSPSESIDSSIDTQFSIFPIPKLHGAVIRDANGRDTINATFTDIVITQPDPNITDKVEYTVSINLTN